MTAYNAGIAEVAALARATADGSPRESRRPVWLSAIDALDGAEALLLPVAQAAE